MEILIYRWVIQVFSLLTVMGCLSIMIFCVMCLVFPDPGDSSRYPALFLINAIVTAFWAAMALLAII